MGKGGRARVSGCGVKRRYFYNTNGKKPAVGGGGAIFICGRYIGQCVGRSARVMVKITEKHSNITTTGARFYLTS